MKAALTQSGSPGTSVVVAWNPTTLAEHGDAVTVTIPEETYETICKGTFDATTGKVTYEKKTYGFQHVVSNGVPTMRRCEC